MREGHGERLHPASQSHACFFLYPMYGFCVSMRPPEKALLLLLLSQMNQTPDIWCISNKVICSRSPSWTTKQSASSSGPSGCLCPPGKCILCTLLGGRCMRRTAWGLQPPHLQVLRGAQNRSQHTARAMLCSGKQNLALQIFCFPTEE